MGEPTNRLRADEGEPTEPRIQAQRVGICPSVCILHKRDSQACAFSLDERGRVVAAIAGQGMFRLSAADAFDLLDFLYEHRNLLATWSAEQAEQ